MGYETTIQFTLDTICPWTYIAKKRLDVARERLKEDHPDVVFNFHIDPYQLYTDAPEQGEDKYQWYLREKYNGDEEQMKKYTTVMSHLGSTSNINFNFHGTIASTLNAHRLIQWIQSNRPGQAAERLLNTLYRMYFEQGAHPSSAQTLLTACKDVGVLDDEVRAVVEDEREGLIDVKRLIREQASNGVDAVPHITVEGRRRDFTLTGAKEVDEYVKTLEQVIKEAN